MVFAVNNIAIDYYIISYIRMYIQSDKLHKLLCLFLLIIDKANFYYVRKIISRQKAGQFSVRRCFFIFIAVHIYCCT